MAATEALIFRLFSWLEWDAVQGLHPWLQEMLALGFLLGLSVIGFAVTRWVLVRAMGLVTRRTRFQWDDLLYEERVLHPLAYLVPIFVVGVGADLLPTLGEPISRLMEAGVVIVLGLVAARSITMALRVYETTPMAKQWPMTSYAQLGKLLVFLVAAVMVVSALLDRSPAIFLSGLGALAAVLLLIFRDTIMSLIASLQFNANRMVRMGDWIEVPAFDADGTVIEMALHTIKVRNWDNTISMIPTHKLAESSFINWRGMQESGGRRIKRALLIDQTSVGFLDAEALARLEKIRLLGDYLGQKKREIEAHNRERGLEPGNVLDGRHLTNLGTFRAYVGAYLRAHPKIHDGQTFLIRQLAPTPNGLPLEIYVFTNDVNWVRYEAIQADIFDHMLAILPEFGLRIFQIPSAHDVGAIARSFSESSPGKS